MNRLRKFIATGLAILAALFVLGVLKACTPLTPADKAQIAKDQVDLGVCATEAHFDKHPDAATPQREAWKTFDDCMVRHGFYEGGLSDAR